MANTPHVIGDLSDLPDGDGVVWKTTDPDRGLDGNVVRPVPGARMERSDGGSADILWIVLEGAGRIETDAGAVPIGVGQIVRIPPHSPRALAAGPDGLVYFTVHVRKPGMRIGRR